MTARRATSVALAVALALAAAGCTRSPERERVDFERMRLQQRGDLYAPTTAFTNGTVMQSPPDSTIPLEAAADPGSLSDSGATRAGLPLPATLEVITLGRQKFATYCAVCHGAGGFGGSLVALNMGPPRPRSLRRAPALTFTPGYIYSVATHGFGRMPAYDPQLTARERWAVAAYVKYLQRGTYLDPDAREDSVRAAEIARIDSIAALEARK